MSEYRETASYAAPFRGKAPSFPTLKAHLDKKGFTEEPLSTNASWENGTRFRFRSKDLKVDMHLQNGILTVVLERNGKRKLVHAVESTTSLDQEMSNFVLEGHQDDTRQELDKAVA